MTQFDILIAGGGIVGLTAALAMSERGFSVAVVDGGALSTDTTSFDPRVYAINLASQELLEKLDVWDKLNSDRISPYRHMHVWDAVNKAHIDFDCRTIAANALGHIIEEAILKEALLAQIKTKDSITLFASSKINQLEQKKDGITLANSNNSWHAKLLMIADGANSLCRQLLKVPLTSWSYHQEAIVALVNVEKEHQQTAYQVFNPDGPLAFLPLSDTRLCSIVWSTTPVKAKQLMALEAEKFNQELTIAFANKLGAVHVKGPRYNFPLIMRHAKQYSGPNWLLLGDAAHTIHPLAGLGLNVGLADITTWLSCLDNSSNKLSLRALGFYQRQRKYEVWQVIILMEGLKTLFSNPMSAIKNLRGMGLRFCNNLNFLKKFFIQQAAGKNIEP